MEGKRKIVVDTNILMESLDVLKKLTEEYEVIVPIVVLEELDNLKDKSNHKARIAIKHLNSNYGDFTFDMIEYEGKPDNQIIAVAKYYNCALATNDICVKVKCRNKGIEVLSFLGMEQDYKGYKILEIDANEDEDNQLFANLYQHPEENILELLTNQYLIIRDNTSSKTLDIMRWDGEKHVKLKLPPKKIISPLNDLQSCALDLLYNEDIPVRVVAGLYGSGKTLCSTAVGLHLVEDKSRYPKLVLVRNNDLNDSGREIGALPGGFEDKTNILFKTSIQHFPQGEYQAEKMRNEGRLETHITHFIKGLSISGYMIVDEAEDLTLKDIKLVGSRLEKDSCIVFSGDWKQASGKFQSDNGMVQLIEQKKGNPLVGIIVLDEDVRSDASKIFADLI